MGHVLNIYQRSTVFLTLGIELKDSPCFEGAHHLLGKQDKQTDMKQGILYRVNGTQRRGSNHR